MTPLPILEASVMEFPQPLLLSLFVVLVLNIVEAMVIVSQFLLLVLAVL